MAIQIFKHGSPRIIQAVDLDIVEGEDHALSLSLTEQPIEDGSSINDHVIFEPREFRITVWASIAPGSPVPALPTRHMKAWRQFKELWKSVTFLDVFSDPEPYRRVLITNVTFPRSVENTNASRFVVTFQQPVFAQTDLTDNLADSVADTGTGEDDLGTQGTADV